MKLTLLKIVFVLLTLLIIAGGGFLFMQYRYVQEQNKTILTGAAVAPVHFKYDYSKTTSTSSYLLFGGAHNPDLFHKDAWDQIKDAGVTSIRTDFFIENELPKNITLEQYKANDHDVQNPKHWQRDWIQMRNNTYKMAKERGLKTIGILSYAPPWLTYTNSRSGLPKDWEVYEDIVKKIYKEHRPYIDYLEIWNEPSFIVFLDPRDSGLTAEESYAQIYLHASKAIREVDAEINDGKKIQLGGLVADNPDRVPTLETLLEHQGIENNIDFISYHTYGHPEPSNSKYLEILKTKHLEKKPFFITEWNYNSDTTKPNEYNTTEKAIPYTGWKLIEFMEMGITGANYFMLNPSKENFMGFYKWNGISAELYPQAKTWKLLSKTLDLGRGNFSLHSPVTKAGIKTIAFTNTKGEKGVILVNPTKEALPVTLSFALPEKHTRIVATTYTASATANPENAINSKVILSKTTAPSYTLYIEPGTVNGVIIKAENNWLDNLNPFIK